MPVYYTILTCCQHIFPGLSNTNCSPFLIPLPLSLSTCCHFIYEMDSGRSPVPWPLRTRNKSVSRRWPYLTSAVQQIYHSAHQVELVWKITAKLVEWRNEWNSNVHIKWCNNQLPFFDSLYSNNFYIYLFSVPPLLPHFCNFLKYKICRISLMLNSKDWKLVEAYRKQVE